MKCYLKILMALNLIFLIYFFYRRIKKLDCFQPSSIEIGDRSFFVIQEDTVVHSIPVSGHKPVLGLMRHPDFGDNHLPSRKEFPAPTDVEKVDDTNDKADVTKNDKCDGTQVTKEEDTEVCLV